MFVKCESNSNRPLDVGLLQGLTEPGLGKQGGELAPEAYSDSVSDGEDSEITGFPVWFG